MRTLEISDETYDKIKDQLGAEDVCDVLTYEDLVGKKWFFRSVTYHLVGYVDKQVGKFLRLNNASWVADSGRFMDAIKHGKLNEVEPVGIAFINLDAVVDFFPWKHSLPTSQK